MKRINTKEITMCRKFRLKINEEKLIELRESTNKNRKRKVVIQKQKIVNRKFDDRK